MEIVVARIGRPHGICGEVTVELRTDDPEGRLAPGTTLRTEPAGAGPLTISGGWVHSGRLILGFEGHDDRSAAESLRNVLLVADVDPAARPADPEEFYDHQLVGLAVRTVADVPVGVVSDVLHLPGQDVLAIATAGGEEVLVPFIAGFVPSVDLEAGALLIDPPPGLIGAPPDVPGD